MCLRQIWSGEGDQSDTEIISMSRIRYNVRSWLLFSITYNHKTNHQGGCDYLAQWCLAIRIIRRFPWMQIITSSRFGSDVTIRNWLTMSSLITTNSGDPAHGFQ